MPRLVADVRTHPLRFQVVDFAVGAVLPLLLVFHGDRWVLKFSEPLPKPNIFVDA